LLLDKVEPIDTTHPYDNWVYNIDVQLQAVSANQMTSWYRDNVDAASVPAVQVIDLDTDATQTTTDPNAIANPDNSVMTATAIAVQYIDIKAEDDVETEITPAEPVTLQSYSYVSKGNNVYQVVNNMSDGTQETTDTLILAGQDRKPETDTDNNLLSGRTAEKGGSIEIEEIVLTEADGGKADGRLTQEAYYTIKGAKADYYVTAGSDGLLGTWDDVIKDSSSDNKLGTYDINADSVQDKLGWVFVKGSSVDNMLLATEYVLDNVQFNDGTNNNTTGAYSGSTLEAKMKEIYNKAGGDKTAIKQNKTISMSYYTGDVTAITSCYVDSHTDSNGNHIGTTSCTNTYKSVGKANIVSTLSTQADVTGVSFFALSIQEVSEAYNDADENVTRDYRRAKYAECGKGNWNNNDTPTDNNGTKVLSTAYWLRSPGYLSTYASDVSTSGNVDTYGSVSSTAAGARPACYATLA
jgi:hypothetical protein